MKAIRLQFILVLLFTTTVGAAHAEFRDLGVGTLATESRGFVAFKDAAGRDLGIVLTTDESERGYLLVVDLNSGKTNQVFYPKGVKKFAAFASMLSKNGRFYTGSGPCLLEFDPSTQQFLYYGIPDPKAKNFVGEAFAEGPDGLIYIGTYPDCRLISFNPQTKEIKDHDRIDLKEEYFNYLIFDSAGWAYAGIGTARCNIVAFNPKTRQRRQIVNESERTQGTGYVFLGADGKAYGVANKQCYRMFEGRSEKIERSEAAKKIPTGVIDWKAKSANLANKRNVQLHLSQTYIDVIDNSSKTKHLSIKFKSGGAKITSLAVGPNDYIYGSSAHPMHLFSYQAPTDELNDLGPVNRVGGGNFCAMATQGQYLVAASYPLGIFHIFDTKQPFNGGYGDQPNPQEVAVWSEDICRPRACIAHPDGHTVLMAGFAGYGFTGGGLGLYDLQTKKATLISHMELIPNESTISMRALPGGDIICGTSIEAPGGGHTIATQATLYVIDWKTKQVSFKTNPIPGVREIISLEIGPDNLVYGICSSSKLFVFNPMTRQVVYRRDLYVSQYGSVSRQALVLADGKLYTVLTKALVCIDPVTFKVTKVVDMPPGVTTAAVYAAGRLYFACGANLWSYDLKP